MHAGAVPRDQRLEQGRGEIRSVHGRRDGEEHPRPPPEYGEDERDRDPHEPERADPRQALEQPVQPADAVVDDPAAEVLVGA